jgi:hypothetical protein
LTEISDAERRAMDLRTWQLMEHAFVRPEDEDVRALCREAQHHPLDSAQLEIVKARIRELFTDPLSDREIALLIDRTPEDGCDKCAAVTYTGPLGPSIIERLPDGRWQKRTPVVRETYTQELTLPDGRPASVTWDVDAARELLRKRPRLPRPLNPESLREWLETKVSFLPEHVWHLPADRCGEPGIVVVLDAGPSPDELQPVRFLIDGSHRAARALAEGRPFFAYHLTEAEQFSIATYRENGVITPMPTAAGPGVQDDEVGLL